MEAQNVAKNKGGFKQIFKHIPTTQLTVSRAVVPKVLFVRLNQSILKMTLNPPPFHSVNYVAYYLKSEPYSAGGKIREP